MKIQLKPDEVKKILTEYIRTKHNLAVSNLYFLHKTTEGLIALGESVDVIELTDEVSNG